MQFVKLDLGMQSGQMPDRRLGAGRLVNCYAVNGAEGGVVELPLMAAAPLQEHFTGGATDAQTAEMIHLSDTSYTYLFAGDKLHYRAATTAGAFTEMSGTYTGPLGYNFLARNNNATDPQVAFCTKAGVLHKITTTTIATVSTAALTSATLTGVMGHDGYIILLFDSGEWFISALNDMTFDALDFTTFQNPEGGYNPLNGAIARGRELIIFSPESMAFYRNTGAADFPYEQLEVRSMGLWSQGILRNISLPDGEDTFIFAASDVNGQYAGIRLLRGYQAAKISTEAIDHAIVTNDYLDDSGSTAGKWNSFTFTERGRAMFAIRAEKFCFVWDSSTGLWHERQTKGLDSWDYIGATQVGANQQHLYSQANGSTLYLERNDETVAAGDKQVKVRTSRDNGKTWRDFRAGKTLSGDSDLNQQIKWTRFGQSKNTGFLVQMDITNAVENDYSQSAGISNISDTMSVVMPVVRAWPGYVRLYRLEAGIAYDNNPIAEDTGKPLALMNVNAGVKSVGVNR